MGMILLGEYRSTRCITEKITPYQIRRMIDSGKVKGEVVDGKYYIDEDTVFPLDVRPYLVRWAQESLREYRKSAKRRGIEFKLTKDDVTYLANRANGMCEITGISFEFEKTEHFRRPFAPSIDRIDSSGPYEIDNCRIVCVSVNSAINEFGLETLVKIAKALEGLDYASI